MPRSDLVYKRVVRDHLPLQQGLRPTVFFVPFIINSERDHRPLQ